MRDTLRRTRPPLTNIHLGQQGDLRYLKALLQWCARRRDFKPQRSMYGVSRHQAAMIERYVRDLVTDLRRHDARRP